MLASKRLLLAVSVTLVATGGCVRTPADVQTFHEASRLLVASPSPPAADAAGWETVRLPDYWDAELRRRSIQGWYRVTVDLAERPTEIWAVYLPRVGQTAGVWVNGVQVHDGKDYLRPERGPGKILKEFLA